MYKEGKNLAKKIGLSQDSNLGLIHVQATRAGNKPEGPILPLYQRGELV